MAEGNSISVIPQENETNISRHSIALVPQEMESNGGVIQQEFEPNGDGVRRNSIPVIPHERQSDSDDFGRAFITMIPQDVGSNADESDDISTKSIPVIRHVVETNVDESNDVSVESNVDESNDGSTNSIPVIPQEMELEGSDIGRNSILEIPMEIYLGGDDIPVVLQEMETNGGDVRRNTIAGIPREMEQEGGDIRRNSIMVIPVGIEATGADVRRRSIAKNIQSRYLRASMGSCHDYCKYGLKKGCEDEHVEASPRAHRKKTSTVNSKASPDSIVTEKRVISVTKKETVSLGKEVDETMEDSLDLEEQPEQLGPSSFPGSVQSLRNSKVVSTITPRPSPGSATNKKPNRSAAPEKGVLSLTKREVVSKKTASSPLKEMKMSTEDSMGSNMKPEQSASSSLTRPMHSVRNSKVVTRTSSKPSQDSETRKLNRSAVMDKKGTSLKKKGTASSKNEMPSSKEVDVSREEQGSRNIGTRKSKKAPHRSGSGGNRSIKKHNRKASLPGEKRTMGPQAVSLSSKQFNKKDSNVSTGSSHNLKGLSHLKDQNDLGKAEPQSPSAKDMPEKILYVIESSTENDTANSTPNDVSIPKPSPSPSSAVSVEGKSKRLKYAMKGIGRIDTPSSEKINLKHVNGAESRATGPLDQDNKGLRRTQYGAQASLSPSSSSSSLSIASSKSAQHEENGAISQHDRSKTVKPIGQSKVQHKTTPRKSSIVGSGNRSSVPHKLAFRRGRVVELQPENRTPIRLKFRRVRLAVEAQNGKGSITSGSIERKEVDDSQSTTGSGIIKRGTNVRKEVGNRQINGEGIKKASIVKKEVGDHQPNGVALRRGIVGRKEVEDGLTNGAKVTSEKVVLRHREQDEVSPSRSLMRKGSSGGLLNGVRSNEEKVVLRHQDVDGKKDDQKLFNNVIEETTSKLVKTRQSKVKALVGAFETVISLQDRKPVATADAC